MTTPAITPSAVLVALAESPGPFESHFAAGGARRPAPLLPALDRPLVAHALSDLAKLGVTRTVVLIDHPIWAPVAAALELVEPRPQSVRLVERDPLDPLLDGIAEARSLLGPGPFLLRFADGLGHGDLEPQLELPTELGNNDAIVLTAGSSARQSGGNRRVAASTNGARRPAELLSLCRMSYRPYSVEVVTVRLVSPACRCVSALSCCLYL